MNKQVMNEYVAANQQKFRTSNFISSRIIFLSSPVSFSCRELKNNGFVAKVTISQGSLLNMPQNSFERWFS